MKTRIKVTKNGVADLYRLPCVRSITKHMLDDSPIVCLRTNLRSLAHTGLVNAYEGDTIVIDGKNVTIERL